MNWRTDILLAVSILGAASLSCHGPETGAASLRIGAESDTSSSMQGSLGTETPNAEIEARLLESNRSRAARREKRRHQRELIALDGMAASFL
jgi:hypothetical protein